MVKIFVDTNVILEWGKGIDKLVKCKNNNKEEMDFYGYKFKNKNDFDIVIPQIVTDELDGLKKNVQDNIGYKQRKQLQKIYINLSQFTEIRNDKNNIKDRFENVTQDNIILNTIIENKEKDLDNEYILYTNDIGLMIKCLHYKIQTVTDIQKIDINEIYNSIKTIKIGSNLLEKLINESEMENVLDIKTDGYYFIDNNDIDCNQYNGVLKISHKGKMISLIEPEKDFSFSNFNSKEVKTIIPKTSEQTIFLDSIINDDIKYLTSLSPSGSGKTLLQLYGQIQIIRKQEFLQEHNRLYDKIVFIVNPSTSVSGSRKELGFLPGNSHEKILPFMNGILDNLKYLFNNEIPERFDIEKKERGLRFEIRPINFLRGSSISRSIIIQDEIQNLTWDEIKTLVSRTSKTSKLILIGDVNQIDENIQVDYTGQVKLINILNKKKDKIPWVNIPMKKSIRNDLINILNEYFDFAQI